MVMVVVEYNRIVVAVVVMEYNRIAVTVVVVVLVENSRIAAVAVLVRYNRIAVAVVVVVVVEEEENNRIVHVVAMVVVEAYIQLFRQRLSHKSVKAYATMPIGILGRKSLALIG